MNLRNGIIVRTGLMIAAAVAIGLTPLAAQEQTEADKERPTGMQAVSAEQVIDDLLKEGVIDKEQADRLNEKYRGKQVEKTEGKTVSQEEFVKDLADEINTRIDELSEQIQVAQQAPKPKSAPEWIDRFKLGGDMRLRYQGDFYGDNNALLLDPNDPDELLNTRNDRNRIRLRARLNAAFTVTDEVYSYIRLSTGNTTQPASTNITLGNYFNKTPVLFDLAYLRYEPIPELTFWGGRIPNPWLCTDLVWDNNLNFDGIAAKFDTQLMRPLRGFVTLGAFPLQEVELNSHDKWLYGAQAGLAYKFNNAFSAKLGVAYYYYSNITGKVNDPDYPNENDWSAPLYLQKGNTLMDIDPTTDYKLALASEYHELDVTAVLDLSILDPIHVILTVDYVKNLGFDRDDVAERTGNDPDDIKEDVIGYQYTLSAGYPQVSGLCQWRAFLTYKHLEGDAVVDAFTDATFHGGGTNCEGYILGMDFGLAKNVYLSAQYMQSNEIDGPVLAIDTVLVDVNVRF